MQRIFCCFASWQCCKQPLVKVRQQYYMQQPVFGMHITHDLMHKRSQDFGLGGGLNRKSHAMTSSEFFEKRDFLWDKE